MNRCIFISYSSQDVAQAESLETRLRAEKFEVWRDKRNIETDWSAEISSALTDHADAVCQALSRNAVDMMLPGEPRSEAIEPMRGISSPGEEDERSAGAAPIQNFKLNTLFDGDQLDFMRRGVHLAIACMGSKSEAL